MMQLCQSAVPEQCSEVDGLRRALASRAVIAKAIGILMERHGIDDEQSFAYLVRMSQNQNIKLRLVAAGVVADTDTALAAARAH
jgi:AmiR/NasT family two-component response regulator